LIRENTGRGKIHKPIGEDKAIAVEPLGVLRVRVEETGDWGIAELSFISQMSKTYREKRTWATGAIPIGAPAHQKPMNEHFTIENNMTHRDGQS
jgi:hypothetical protein